MNYKQIRESLWRWAGFPTTDGRQDNLTQEIREAINQAQNECFILTPFWWFNLERWTISVVGSTMSYEIDDWCRMPTRVWVEGDSAGPVDFVSPEETDRQGLRSTSFFEAADGPYQFTFKEVRKTATATFVGNTVVGNTVFTRTSGDAIANTWVGKRIAVNGEPVDYKVTAVNTSANTVTVDKAYVPMLVESEGTTAGGSNTTAGTLLVSPGPAWQLDFTPMPSAAATVYVWGAARERYLTADSDIPELPERWHEAIVLLAKRRLAAYLRRPLEEQGALKSEAREMLDKMKKIDLPMGGARRMTYESGFKSKYSPMRNYRPANDVYPEYRGR